MPDDLSPITTPEAPPAPQTNQDLADKVLSIERARQDAERARQLDRESLLQAMDEKFEKLAQKLEGQKPDPNDPLGALKDEDLKAVVAQGAEDNPQRYAIAQEELWKRREKKVLERAREETDARLMAERNIAVAVEKMKQRFGPEIVQEGSDLRNRAQMHMRALQQQYGIGVAADPRAQLQAAEAAHNDILREKLKKSEAKEKELDEYKRRAAMEHGNQAFQRPGEDTKDLLKKGKVDEAIKSLNLAQRLFGTRE